MKFKDAYDLDSEVVSQRDWQFVENQEGEVELYIRGKFQCSWMGDISVEPVLQGLYRYTYSMGSDSKLREIKSVFGIR